MKQKVRRYKLKRELGLFEATVYGVGIVLGAGIYALIGVAAGEAGNAMWLSFIIAAIIASFTGLSYAELSSLYPKEAAEYVYAQHAFKRRYISLFISLIFVVSGTIAAATVALGFSGYFIKLITDLGLAGYFFNLFGSLLSFAPAPILVATFLIIILSLINYAGIKDSARYNAIATFIEIAGLVLVVMVGMFFVGNSIGQIDYLAMPSGIYGMIIATAMIFFAYIGFEDLANVSEETKNPTKIIPKAMILSLVISTILYIAVALSAISVLGWENLSQSAAPLTDVIASVIPNGGIVMSLIALFATSNTVLIALIVISRVLYGLSNQHSFPRVFSRIGKTGTPYLSISLVMLIALFALSFGGIETIAMLTVFGIFIVYTTMNLALIVLRYTNPAKRPFRSPVNIGKFPVLAFLGLASSLVMLYYILTYFVL